jgi:hypothetical protein
MATALAAREIGSLFLDESTLEGIVASPTIKGHLYLIFGIALVTALALGALLTARRARKDGLSLWNRVSRRFALHLFAPLIAGGLFALALAQSGQYQLVCPAMLLFFGLALIGAGHLTIAGTTILGIIESALGLAGLLRTDFGLIFWGVGFGLATAVYGVVLHQSYER